MIAGCPDCRRRHQFPGPVAERCPACGGGPLHEDAEAELPEVEVAGLAEIDARRLPSVLQPWVDATPCRPPGLDAGAIARAATRAWWPVWLVDVQVRGEWSAQAGIEEAVESAVEELRNGRWETRRVRRNEVRHVPRLGTLDRRYENLVVPAIGAPSSLLSTPRLGAFQPEGAPWMLPEVDGEARDAPLEAAVRTAVREDLVRALGCRDVRDLQLTRAPTPAHWTFLLVPMWVMTWTDEAGVVHPVAVNAVTGEVAGRRQASARLARRRLAQGLGLSVLVLAGAAVLGAVGLLVPLVLPLAVLALLVAIVPAVWGIRELQRSSSFNRAEAERWSPAPGR